MPDVYAFYHVAACPSCLTPLSVSSRESGTTITEIFMLQKPSWLEAQEAEPLCAEDALALLRAAEIENENLRQIIESMVKQREPVLEEMKARIERIAAELDLQRDARYAGELAEARELAKGRNVL